MRINDILPEDDDKKWDWLRRGGTTPNMPRGWYDPTVLNNPQNIWRDEPHTKVQLDPDWVAANPQKAKELHKSGSREVGGKYTDTEIRHGDIVPDRFQAKTKPGELGFGDRSASDAENRFVNRAAQGFSTANPDLMKRKTGSGVRGSVSKSAADERERHMDLRFAQRQSTDSGYAGPKTHPKDLPDQGPRKPSTAMSRFKSLFNPNWNKRTGE